MTISVEYREFIALGLMLVAAIGFSAIAILLPVLLGPRRTHSLVKDSAYECGLPTLRDQARFSVKFHVVAMLFLLFDIEVVFLIGWAALFRDLVRPAALGGLGWPMLVGGALFIAILEVGHLYAWKKGALDWAPARSRRRKAPLPS